MKVSSLSVAAAVFMAMYGTASAQSLSLPNPMTSAYQYGDAYSYSLPILANYYDLQYGGGTGPGNPYYVSSSSVGSYVVVGTSSNGNPETTNYPNPITLPGVMDGAFVTSSGSVDTFAMTTANDPGGYIQTDGLWSSTISALMGYVGTGNVPIFLFNNNQANSGTAADQQLLFWGQIAISGQGKDTLYFDLSNNGNTANNQGGFLANSGIPGPYSNVGNYTNTSGAGPEFGGYVISGGQLCVNATGDVVACDSADVADVINHNLGDNQAAYAAIFPELNAILSSSNFGGYTDITLDVKMLNLNSGGETIFLLPGQVQQNIVPEPSTILLVGAGLAGIGIFGRRKNRK